MASGSPNFSSATEKSWKTDFVDQSVIEALEEHISLQLSLSASESEGSSARPYARFCSIVQSSGMGKSRLLDQFSTTYFMIPVNLRSSEARG
jgi:hypothetical protein